MCNCITSMPTIKFLSDFTISSTLRRSCEWIFLSARAIPMQIRFASPTHECRSVVCRTCPLLIIFNAWNKVTAKCSLTIQRISVLNIATSHHQPHRHHHHQTETHQAWIGLEFHTLLKLNRRRVRTSLFVLHYFAHSPEFNSRLCLRTIAIYTNHK